MNQDDPIKETSKYSKIVGTTHGDIQIRNCYRNTSESFRKRGDGKSNVSSKLHIPKASLDDILEYDTQCVGVDRIDFNIGYVKENCLPCCTTCNIAKHTHDVDYFKNWIVKVYNNFAIKFTDKGLCSENFPLPDKHNVINWTTEG